MHKKLNESVHKPISVCQYMQTCETRTSTTVRHCHFMIKIEVI